MENIRYGRLDATDEEVIQAAKTASAYSFIMRLPHGFDTVLEGDGANLSQGQRQLFKYSQSGYFQGSDSGFWMRRPALVDTAQRSTSSTAWTV